MQIKKTHTWAVIVLFTCPTNDLRGQKLLVKWRQVALFLSFFPEVHICDSHPVLTHQPWMSAKSTVKNKTLAVKTNYLVVRLIHSVTILPFTTAAWVLSSASRHGMVCGHQEGQMGFSPCTPEAVQSKSAETLQSVLKVNRGRYSSIWLTL